MEFVALPLLFIIWYFVYDAKPNRKDEIGMIWEEESSSKRIKIKDIINQINS